MPTRTAQLLLGWLGVTSRPKKITQVFGRTQWPFSLLVLPQMFSLWSRTQKIRDDGGGGSLNSKAANPVDEALLKTCFPCHVPIESRDFVFTHYSP